MRLFLLRIACVSVTCATLLPAQSKWVSVGNDGHLHYAATSTGDRIPDFSYAGYDGGGTALPHVTTVLKVSPSGQDDTAAIQQALDKASAFSQSNGFRGAVELGAGTFHCSGTLKIVTSGVVLRGAGQDRTTIEMTGEPHRGIEISGSFYEKAEGEATALTDSYVPYGAMTIHVASTAGLRSGDTVRITRPVTPQWLAYMGMDHLTRTGRDEHWVGDRLIVRRRIAKVGSNFVTFDVPLMDSYNATYTGVNAVTVQKVNVTGQIDHVAIEDLRLKAPARSIAMEDAHYDGIFMTNAVDSWLRAVELEDVTDGVRIETGTERITVQQVDVTQHKAITSSAKNFQFSINGSQILLDHCSGKGDLVFYIATQARQQGPVVALHCHFEGNGAIQPHQRWSTGLLVDNCEVPDGGIDMKNRGIMGSGHGWAIGWAVVWNSTARSFVIQQAPGTLTWSIGNRGSQELAAMPTGNGDRKHQPPLPQGMIESQGKRVKPDSLYIEQLRERLGDAAVKSVGY